MGTEFKNKTKKDINCFGYLQKTPFDLPLKTSFNDLPVCNATEFLKLKVENQKLPDLQKDLFCSY